MKVFHAEAAEQITCPTCHNGQFAQGATTVTLERDGALVIIRNVPAKRCDTCGVYNLSGTVATALYEKAEAAINRDAELEVLSCGA